MSVDIPSLAAVKYKLLDADNDNGSVVYFRVNRSLLDRNLQLDDGLSCEEVVSNDGHDVVNRGEVLHPILYDLILLL